MPLPERKLLYVCSVLSVSCKDREGSVPRRVQNELIELICIGCEIPCAKQKIKLLSVLKLCRALLSDLTDKVCFQKVTGRDYCLLAL